MAVIDVLNIKGEKVSEVELADTIFNIPVKTSVLHEVVTMQLAKKRSGTASVKHRSDITGSGKKLFRQKGTGRARRGDVKSPLLRGGGSVFGPDPRSYAYKIPKKVKKLALKMALSSKLDLNEIVVLNEFELERIKTKDVTETLNALGLKKALIVTEKENEKLEISSRNIPGIKVLRSAGLNVYDILKYDKLILIKPSITEIEGRLSV
ncbi:MAG: 50S ribosomal protein L4 [Desulfobacteraceae bacterium 4572_123]|nr:MAG: 50S ribosomal protein L4 [Desulfobacteraceae bacterium 4572_123]